MGGAEVPFQGIVQTDAYSVYGPRMSPNHLSDHPTYRELYVCRGCELM
jgi:hypothetical protein